MAQKKKEKISSPSGAKSVFQMHFKRKNAQAEKKKAASQRKTTTGDGPTNSKVGAAMKMSELREKNQSQKTKRVGASSGAKNQRDKDWRKDKDGYNTPKASLRKDMNDKKYAKSAAAARKREAERKKKKKEK